MNDSPYHTIVIGGGISGLACCVKLIEQGITDILLIEANDSLGGRIKTVPFRKIIFKI
jgi:uncharacterized protein with NAD-binding domain and iron-sulfur cluster